MTAYREISPENFQPWNGEPINGVMHPINIVELWSAAELEAIGLYIPKPATIPAGTNEIGRSVQRVEGVVKFVLDTVDKPLDEVKADLIGLAHQHVEAVGRAFVESYPEIEQQSFDKKEAQARAIVGGESDPTKFPLIAEEISLSGKTAAEAATRIVGNAAVLERISGALSGFRQRAEDDINASGDFASATAALDAAKASLAISIAAITS